jgi:hypothetical protein
MTPARTTTVTETSTGRRAVARTPVRNGEDPLQFGENEPSPTNSSNTADSSLVVLDDSGGGTPNRPPPISTGMNYASGSDSDEDLEEPEVERVSTRSMSRRGRTVTISDGAGGGDDGGDDEDGGDLSDDDSGSEDSLKDEALSESEFSSKSVRGARTLEGLVELSAETCRSPGKLICAITRAEIRAICARKEPCSRHKKEDKKQYPPGFYEPVPPALIKGSCKEYAKQNGPYLSYEEKEALSDKIRSEMEEVAVLDPEDPEDAEEIEELNSLNQNQTPSGDDMGSRQNLSEEEVRSLLTGSQAPPAQTRSSRAQGAGTAKPNKSKQEAKVPTLWGLQTLSDGAMRWVGSPVDALPYLESKKWELIHDHFDSYAQALAWMNAKPPQFKVKPKPKRQESLETEYEYETDVEYSDDDAEDEPARPRLSEAKRKKRAAKHRRNRQNRQNRKAKKDKAAASKKGTRRSAGSGGGDEPPSASSDSSSGSSSDDSSISSDDFSDTSDESSTSSSDSSSSSSSSRSRNRRHKRSQKKKFNSHYKKSKKSRRYSRVKGQRGGRTKMVVEGSDPSTGNRNKIFGLEVDGPKIDKALVPRDVASKDRSEILNSAMDVAALPGMSASLNGGDQEDSFNAQLLQNAVMEMAQQGGRNKVIASDAGWQNDKRNALGKITSSEKIAPFLKALVKAKEPQLAKESSAYRKLLSVRRFDSKSIEWFLRFGALPLLTSRTLADYVDFVYRVRQMAWDHQGTWATSPAKAMLEAHTEKLLEIRRNALLRRDVVLKVYIHFRDSAVDGFYQEEMAEAVWKKLAALETQFQIEKARSGNTHPEPELPVAGDGGKKKKEGDGKNRNERPCPWCQSYKTHTLLSLSNSKELCPFKGLPKAKAQGAAHDFLAHYQRNQDSGSDETAQACCQRVLATWQ